MEAIGYSAFRNGMKDKMRELRDSADVLLVTNNDPSENIVVMNARDYESLMETVRIYENPYLFDKIREGDRQTAEGNISRHDIIEDSFDD